MITLAYYVSSLGFLVAALIMGRAVRSFGKSTLGSIFTYLFVGTGIFFVITVFQTLGADFFGVSDESMDVWWHFMFYLAMFSYYFGLKALIGLGTSDPSVSSQSAIAPEKAWALFSAAALIVIFIIPKIAEPLVLTYLASPLATLGLHHFLSFIVAGIVGSYLFAAKKNLGQIGSAIATPMIIAIWALAFQHFWELLFESWKVVIVTSENGEGIERIFLLAAAVGVTYAAWRLKSFAQR